MVQDQIKEISNLSYKSKSTKNSKIKRELETEVKNILVDLKKEALTSFKDETDVKKFLDNIINFNKYSFNNMCLIRAQNKDATYVASFKTFSEMGYFPKKGEKGIKILVPSFLTRVKIKNNDGTVEITPLYTLTDEEKQKYSNINDDTITYHDKILKSFSVGTVFDVSQTNMPIDLINEKLNPMLDDPKADTVADTFIKAIYKDGFKVKYDETQNGAKGYCDLENNTIVVKKGLSNLMRLKVIVHEYAHALAHSHLKENGMEYIHNREKYETEAEAIAYVVSKYLGLDTRDYSQTYLYSWSKNKDFKEIDDSFSTIVNFSKKIISNYNKILKKNNTFSEDIESVSI